MLQNKMVHPILPLKNIKRWYFVYRRLDRYLIILKKTKVFSLLSFKEQLYNTKKNMSIKTFLVCIFKRTMVFL